MASSVEQETSEMTLLDMVERLEVMSESVFNDRRQNKYCEYISLFLSHFGKERYIVTGSTQEYTRLRIRENEGDYDYLIISEKIIPVECLEYKSDLPVFVQINGIPIKELFPSVEMVDGKYLPSDLLSSIRPEAFKHAKDMFHLVSRLYSTGGEHTLNIAFDQEIKPGISIVNYKDPKFEGRIVEGKEKRNSDKIMENVNERLQNEPREVKELTFSAAKTVINLVEKYDKFDPSNDKDVESGFLQTYGPVLRAIDDDGKMNQESMSASEPNKLRMDSDFDSGKSTLSTSRLDTAMTNEKNTETEAGTNTNDFVLQYLSKSSKDFILAFPLSGKPKYLDEWKHRERMSQWPSMDVIEDICSSEFFVVAKPAVDNPEQERDFCLAYNMAEMKLAKAMTTVQKSVILIIKAFQKSILAEFSNDLTTFHWKTAVYWESECVEHTLLEVNTEANILLFLEKVLVRITRSLCESELEHYFVPSNLFAGNSEDKRYEIMTKVAEIQEDIVGTLRHFFVNQDVHEYKIDMISRGKIKEFQEYNHDTGDNSVVNIIISTLRGFSGENKEVLRQAITNVLTEGLSFFIEEDAIKRKKEDTDQNSQLILSLLGLDVTRGVLINNCVSLLMDQVSGEGEINAEEICRNFLALVLQRVCTGR